jgi:hypothetical protein
MNLKYKKSKLVESMGYDIVSQPSYGNKPQSIKLTESQFKRLVESYMEVKDKTIAEINETFGDGDIGGLTGHDTDANLDGPEDFNTTSGYDLPEDAILDELSDEEEILETSRDSEGEYRGAPSQVEKRDTYDGRPGKVVGVYSNIKKQREQ